MCRTARNSGSAKVGCGAPGNKLKRAERYVLRVPGRPRFARAQSVGQTTRRPGPATTRVAASGCMLRPRGVCHPPSPAEPFVDGDTCTHSSNGQYA
jgi:hypothetical protein